MALKTRGGAFRALVAVAVATSVLVGVGVADAEVAWPPPDPGPVTLSGEVANSPFVSGDIDGAVAVWRVFDFDTGQATVQASTWNGSSWSQTVDLFASDMCSCFEPRVSGDDSSAVAVWDGFDGTDPVVQAATFNGTAWSAPQNLSDPVDEGARPQVVGDASGAVAAWTLIVPNVPDIFEIVQGATFDGSSWSMPVDLSAAASQHELGDLAGTASSAVAVWQSVDPEPAQAATFDGTGWSTPLEISPPGQEATDPRVAGDASGAVAVFQYDSGTDLTVRASTFDGTSWSGQHDFTTGNVFGIDVTGDESGAVAAWNRAETTERSIEASTLVGGSWSAPVDVESLDPLAGDNPLRPKLSGDETGAVAVWNIAGTATDAIRAATFDGATWSQPTELNAPLDGLGTSNPRVTGDDDGALALWIEVANAPPVVKAALGAPKQVTLGVPGGSATISTSSGGIMRAVRSDVPASPTPPAGVDFPYGLIGFDVVNLTPGDSATITVTLPAPVDEYWKLQNDAWAQVTGATFAGNEVTFTITDGGAFDADGTANGTIVDPGAPGVAQVPPPTVPTTTPGPAPAAIDVTPTFTG